jgi:hypothetical protein
MTIRNPSSQQTAEYCTKLTVWVLILQLTTHKMAMSGTQTELKVSTIHMSSRPPFPELASAEFMSAMSAYKTSYVTIQGTKGLILLPWFPLSIYHNLCMWAYYVQ